MGDGVAWRGELRVRVCEPRKEGAGGTTAVPVEASEEGSASAPRGSVYISYGVESETTLPHFAASRMSARRRYSDFAFLRSVLAKTYPACVVPPLPEKHRIGTCASDTGYLTGERFSTAFVQRRCMELQLFLERVCRHPVLSCAQVLEQFLSSPEWQVEMHRHSGQAIVAQGPGAAPPAAGWLDSMGDVLVNAFARVRQPDARFVEMRAALAGEEERVARWERLLLRQRQHVSVAAFDELYATSIHASSEDLSTDYRDMAQALEHLAVLESGLAGALQRTATAMDTYADLGAKMTFQVTDDVLSYLHAQHAYLASHKALLHQCDAQQLDFEGLTDYLHAAVKERERLAALDGGAGGRVRGPGWGGYMRSAVDRVRGVDEEQARIERMQRLDGRIAELREAAQASHEQSQSFATHVEQEHQVYELGRRRECVQLLSTLADGHASYCERGVAVWDELIGALDGPLPPPRALGEEQES